MRIIPVREVMVVLILLLLCAGSAALVPDAENMWNGTWTDETYTIFIQQNGTEIAGNYIPFDLETYDAGLLEGTLSEDQKTFSGVWIESGLQEATLSEDGMSFSGTGSTNPVGTLTEPRTYEATGTRVGTPTDPDNLWSGTWETPRKIYNLTQDGTTISGTNEPLPETDDEPGVFKGTVSEDGNTMSVEWVESGNFTFILSDDGIFWNGTYTDLLDPSAELFPWNATKMQ